MIVALDIDDTITAHPRFFRCLSHAVRREGGTVHVISTRTDAPRVRLATERELRKIGVAWDGLYLLPGAEQAQRSCPHRALDWWNQYLWQKVEYCVRARVDAVFDDDEKVVALFARFAPSIAVWRV